MTDPLEIALYTLDKAEVILEAALLARAYGTPWDEFDEQCEHFLRRNEPESKFHNSGFAPRYDPEWRNKT